MSKPKNTLGKLLRALSRHRPALLLAFLFAAAASLAGVTATLHVGRAIDFVAGAGDVDFAGLYRTLILLGTLYGAFALFTWFVSQLANHIACRTARDLRQRAFAKLGRLPLAYFDATPHGDVVSRFTNDLDNVGDALALTVTSLFSGIVLVVCALFFMLSLDVRITLVILVVTPVSFLVAYIVARASQKTHRRQQSVVGELSGFVSEIVGNQKTVQALGCEAPGVERFREINNRLYTAGKNAQFASSLVNPTTRFVDHISYLLVGVVGGMAAVLSGVSVGVVSSFLIYSAQFAKPFNELSGIMNHLQTAFASLDRVFSLLEEPEEEPDSPGTAPLAHPRGHITFRDVAFSYTPDRPLIEGLNIDAAPGSLVAIVGPTGAGKTTIVNLLMRFYELSGGVISVDGRDVRLIQKDSLRRSFGMVLQETWLFSGTIAENITYGKPDATREEMTAAAKFAHAHAFIVQMPQGYDTRITEDGGNLSQGQKQLLTIARVMLTDPAMLILDEATSSIDTLTEIRVQRAFFKMMQGRSSFVIAHRLSTIASADLILVLDKGRIIETGTHRKLLEKGGFYKKLYESQFQ